MNFQYPFVAPGPLPDGEEAENEGAVSCNHSRTTTSSCKRGNDCKMAWARVAVGVYGF